jgi:hypothetical protein
MTITHDRERVAFFNTPKREVSEVRGRPNLVSFITLAAVQKLNNFSRFILTNVIVNPSYFS